MSKVLLNMSRHKMPKEADKLFPERVTVWVPPVDVEADEIHAHTLELATALIDGKYRRYKSKILAGEFEVLLSGLTPLTIAQVEMLHGLSNKPVLARFVTKQGEDFIISTEPIDGRLLYEQAQIIREQFQ